MVLVLKKYGGLGLGLETQSLGLGLDKKVLFTSLLTMHRIVVGILSWLSVRDEVGERCMFAILW